MPLIVPILRACFLFLNVFDTYKTLKVPPPSTRNGGRPTIRAMSHRKRAMKGCMTVWLVWCCFTIYEKTLDSVIGIFIPFYNEIKSLILIFFMLTRSRGAEPVYLHLMRPMIKPYTGPLDSLLELTDTFGDLVVLICAIPYHMMMSLYYRVRPRKQDRPEPGDEARATEEVEKRSQSPSEAGEEEEPVSAPPVRGTVRVRRRPLQEAHERTRVTRAASAIPVAANGMKAKPQKAEHEIWYPPPPAYDESPPSEPNEPQQGLPTPPAECRAPLTRNTSMEDWRQYEPFPAAYPMTPLPPRIHLTASEQPARHQLADISEERSMYYSYIADETVQVEEQGFQESLQLLREKPRSAGNLSDKHHAEGGSAEDEMEVEEEVEAYEDDDDDDEFNITLRTPSVMKRVQNMSNLTSSSMDRESNISSAGFSTVGNNSPLMRTRTNSGASTTLYDSDSSSHAGRKRPLPSTEEARPARRPLNDRTTSTATVRQQRTNPKHLTINAPHFAARTQSTSSSSSTENKVVGADSALKMRRVGSKDDSRKESVVRTRPTLRAGVENGAREAAVRKATSLANVPRGTQARPGMTRVSRRPDSVKADAD